MKIYRGFRFRIYPDVKQAARLEAWSHSLRFLWNLAHEQRLMGLRRPVRVYPKAFDQHKELTELRAVTPWLADVPRNACEALLTELDGAWQMCFAGLTRTPKWKRRGVWIGICENHKNDVRLVQDGIKFVRLGVIRAVLHREVAGTPKRLTVTRDGDQWFASIVCEVEAPTPDPRTDPVVGIDRGIASLLATSDGVLLPNPKFYERSLKRLARAQRIVSRRKKGSKNREKAKVRVMRLHRKVRRQREHVLHVESSRLAKSHGVVVIEKLNVKGMIRGRGLSRSIADAGWSRFAEMLRYKLAWTGGTLVEVPAQYSSQTCSACGHVDAASRNREAFCCTGCGYVDHADLNAAKVIKSRANRSALPVEGSALEASQRSRKAKVGPPKPRTLTPHGDRNDP